MHGLAVQAVLGYAQIDLFGKPPLVFGKYNDRELKEGEVRKLLKAFYSDGVQRFHDIHAIPILAKPEWYQSDSLTDNEKAMSELPILRWTEEGKREKGILAMGGRHRLNAVRHWRKNAQASWEKANKAYEDAKKRPDEVKEGELSKLGESLDDCEDELEGAGLWMVTIYDYGERCGLEGEE